MFIWAMYVVPRFWIFWIFYDLFTLLNFIFTCNVQSCPLPFPLHTLLKVSFIVKKTPQYTLPVCYFELKLGFVPLFAYRFIILKAKSKTNKKQNENKPKNITKNPKHKRKQF